MNAPILEIIGLTCVVDNSTNKELVGIAGKISNENKNMLTLETEFGEKLIPKNTCEFKIIKNDDVVKINGLELLKRPHERLEILS